jgi:hypothetical protein
MEDDEGSIQILEPDVDQQYVPEGKPASSAGLAKENPAVRQKPPVLIVERQVMPDTPPRQRTEQANATGGNVQQPTPMTVTGTAPTAASTVQGTVPGTHEAPLPVDRIVNIVNEPARIAAKESDDWWQNAMGKTVTLTIQFFLMAIVVFLLFIVLNPPFVQDTSMPLQKQSASWSKAAFGATLAGLAFLVLPPLYGIASSRFFPNDLLAATGLRQK